MISCIFSIFCFLPAVFSNIEPSGAMLHSYFDLSPIAEYYGSEAKNDMDNQRWLNPVIDTNFEEDRDDFELSDILALASGDIDHDEDKMTDEKRAFLVDLHNIYRSNTTGTVPAASNMKLMSYNNTLQLEKNAYEYLRICQMKHGYAKNDKLNALQGQNLYNGPAKSWSRSMYLFYMEHIWYYWNNGTCWKSTAKNKYICGHMVQVMWHNSSYIGGAMRTHCFPKEKRLMIHNIHYLPRGNILDYGFRIYKYGWHCTRCEPGMLCFNNLCMWKFQCKDNKVACKCKLNCQNCVQPDWKQCRCGTCKTGWDWEDCSYTCRNEIDLHYKKYPCRNSLKMRCHYPGQYWWYMGCQNFCGECFTRKDKGANMKDLCCGGKVCDLFHVLNETTCECQVDCPSDICLFPPSTTTPKVNMVLLAAPTKPPNKLPPPTKLPPPRLNRSPSLTSSSFRCFIAVVINIFITFILPLSLIE